MLLVAKPHRDPGMRMVIGVFITPLPPPPLQRSEQRGKIILFFYQNCSLEELRWLVRIILRDLGYGISVKFVLNCYHRQAYTSYSNRSDLSWVSEEFYDPKKRVEEPGISLFNPFQPMLADKIAFEHIER